MHLLKKKCIIFLSPNIDVIISDFYLNIFEQTDFCDHLLFIYIVLHIS